MDKKRSQRIANQRKRQSELYKTYIKTSAVGLEVGLAIALGILFGYFIDRYFNFSPWGLVVGAIVGFIAAIKRLWVFSKNYVEKNKNDIK